MRIRAHHTQAYADGACCRGDAEGHGGFADLTLMVLVHVDVLAFVAAVRTAIGAMRIVVACGAR
ncbi:hypothetical protein GCM10023353_10240 [Tomitella cavernea]|uniref:Uncharacterized protein n=1 Tax=Tomitella cavernea TaxID=1387982 RepID=A0ABP9CDD7_9ACTN